MSLELRAVGALGLEGMPSTEQLLAEQGVQPMTAGDAAWALVALAAVLYAAAFCALAARAPRFQALHEQPPCGVAYRRADEPVAERMSERARARSAKSPGRRRRAKDE